MKPFVTPDTTATDTTTTYHQPTTTKSLHFKPSILAFFAASPQKNIDGKNVQNMYKILTWHVEVLALEPDNAYYPQTQNSRNWWLFLT